jgi:hypothetical protein
MISEKALQHFSISAFSSNGVALAREAGARQREVPVSEGGRRIYTTAELLKC